MCHCDLVWMELLCTLCPMNPCIIWGVVVWYMIGAVWFFNSLRSFLLSLSTDVSKYICICKNGSLPALRLLVICAPLLCDLLCYDDTI